LLLPTTVTPTGVADLPGELAMAWCQVLVRVVLVACALAALAEADSLRPRPVAQVSQLLPAEHYLSTAADMRGARAASADAAATAPQLTVLVKFSDTALVRARGTSIDAQDLECKQHIDEVLERFRQDGLQLLSIFGNVGTELEAFLDRAQQASGNQEADLRGITRIVVPGSDISKMVEVGHALEATQCVEYISTEFDSVEPPCSDNFDDRETPDFKYRQTYLGPDPGMDVDWAQSQGADGRDVHYSDVEYALLHDHEDLPNVRMGRGEPHSEVVQWHDHGTASVAIAVGLNNSQGVVGIAPAAEAAFYTEMSTTDWGWSRVQAVFDAVSHSRPGDIVLLEMQTTGPREADAEHPYVYLPAETNRAVWEVVKAATDAGVIVVAAAGNGYLDTWGSYSLDGPLYQLPYWRAWGDSGAIIVGAGSPDALHEKMAFSEYGSRVDVHAWGMYVMTAGYGDCGRSQFSTREYTSSFSGTSSASALVAAAATALQSLAKKESHLLTPSEMRELLKSTGIPQGGRNTDQSIGPHINLRNAIEELRRQQQQPTTSTVVFATSTIALTTSPTAAPTTSSETTATSSTTTATMTATQTLTALSGTTTATATTTSTSFLDENVCQCSCVCECSVAEDSSERSIAEVSLRGSQGTDSGRIVESGSTITAYVGAVAGIGSILMTSCTGYLVGRYSAGQY